MCRLIYITEISLHVTLNNNPIHSVPFVLYPFPSFEAVYCFISGRRRLAAARYWVICLFLDLDVKPPIIQTNAYRPSLFIYYYSFSAIKGKILEKSTFQCSGDTYGFPTDPKHSEDDIRYTIAVLEIFKVCPTVVRTTLLCCCRTF